MARKIIGGTTKCIVCLRKADIFGGHVQKGNVDVLAGWCNEHRNTPLVNLLMRKGCYGGWSPKYGLRKNNT